MWARGAAPGFPADRLPESPGEASHGFPTCLLEKDQLMSMHTFRPPRVFGVEATERRLTSDIGLPRTIICALAGAALACLTAAPTASAHVTVQPREAPPSSSQVFSVRVPTEREEATVHVRVEFPEGLTVSRFEPVPGWARQVERDAQQRITAVVWSGGQIGPGEFQDFRFQARTPADSGELTFRASQTYAGGEKLEWAGPEGSERPAATVRVGSSTAVAGATPATIAAAPRGESPTSAEGSDLPLFVALGSGVIALLALILSIVGLAQRSSGPR